MTQADIGLIGLAVMGQNLALNISDRGYRVAVHNRTRQVTDSFMQGAAKDAGIIAAADIADLVARLKRPRTLLLMIKAGKPVDQMIEQLRPHLQPGDIILDGGNSHFSDTDRRVEQLAEEGIRFIGCGISGGEAGARHGPSIMPGGEASAWPAVRPLLQSIAASVGDQPCCEWMGPRGAGHFVKMVHNGIEYGDMQLICEAYHLMRSPLRMSHDEMQQRFQSWNTGVLDSYLIGITAAILGRKTSDGAPLLDLILDAAGQKGTGKWTAVNALEQGIPLTLIGEAVFARALSAQIDERQRAAEYYPPSGVKFDGDREEALNALHHALYASKIISYAQGYMLLREASEQFGWQLDYAAIAKIWRGGCIIRSRFLDNIMDAFNRRPDLDNLLFDDFFLTEIKQAEPGWRSTLMLGIEQGIPLPAFSSALAFFDGYRSSRLPANLIQAQRDYFGAHRYERVDHRRGALFHTDWTNETDPASNTAE